MTSHRNISPFANSCANTSAVLRRFSLDKVVKTAFDAHSEFSESSYTGVIDIRSGLDDDLMVAFNIIISQMNRHSQIKKNQFRLYLK